MSKERNSVCREDFMISEMWMDVKKTTENKEIVTILINAICRELHCCKFFHIYCPFEDFSMRFWFFNLYNKNTIKLSHLWADWTQCIFKRVWGRKGISFGVVYKKTVTTRSARWTFLIHRNQGITISWN